MAKKTNTAEPKTRKTFVEGFKRNLERLVIVYEKNASKAAKKGLAALADDLSLIKLAAQKSLETLASIPSDHKTPKASKGKAIAVGDTVWLSPKHAKTYCALPGISLETPLTVVCVLPTGHMILQSGAVTLSLARVQVRTEAPVQTPASTEIVDPAAS